MQLTEIITLKTLPTPFFLTRTRSTIKRNFVPFLLREIRPHHYQYWGCHIHAVYGHPSEDSERCSSPVVCTL